MTIWPLNDEVLKEMRAKQHESEEADRRTVYP
jgi:hypothetical protein